MCNPTISLMIRFESWFYYHFVYFLRGFETTCLAFYTPENTLCKPNWKENIKLFNLMFLYLFTKNFNQGSISMDSNPSVIRPLLICNMNQEVMAEVPPTSMTKKISCDSTACYISTFHTQYFPSSKPHPDRRWPQKVRIASGHCNNII